MLVMFINKITFLYIPKVACWIKKTPDLTNLYQIYFAEKI